MVTWSSPLLAEGGLLLAMKGQYPTDELAELADGVELCGVEQLLVPGINAERHLVVLRVTRRV